MHSNWSLQKCDLDMADEKKVVDISFPSPARCAILFLMILFLKVASGLDSGSNSDKDNWNASGDNHNVSQFCGTP